MKNSYISLGYRCNHKCVTCPLTLADKRSENTPLVVIKNVLDKLGRNDHVTISGGEPTLYHSLYCVLQMCRERNLSATILTNVSGFADRRYAEKLAELCVCDDVDIVTALYHCDAVRHDAITGVAGSFDVSMQGLENLLELGYHVTIKLIIAKYNYEDLGKIAVFLRDKYGNSVAVQLTSMDYSGSAFRNHEKYFVTFEEYQPHLENMLDLLRAARMNVSLIEMPLCHLDPYYWRLFPRKNVVTNLYVAPNADNAQSTLTDLANQCNTNYRVCMGCDARFLCHGAWRSAVELGGEGLLKAIKSM